MKEFPLTCLRKPQSGNHLACSVHGSSSASQLHSPPSQKKHLTLSEYPIKDEQFQWVLSLTMCSQILLSVAVIYVFIVHHVYCVMRGGVCLPWTQNNRKLSDALHSICSLIAHRCKKIPTTRVDLGFGRGLTAISLCRTLAWRPQWHIVGYTDVPSKFPSRLH